MCGVRRSKRTTYCKFTAIQLLFLQNCITFQQMGKPILIEFSASPEPGEMYDFLGRRVFFWIRHHMAVRTEIIPFPQAPGLFELRFLAGYPDRTPHDFCVHSLADSAVYIAIPPGTYIQRQVFAL